VLSYRRELRRQKSGTTSPALPLVKLYVSSKALICRLSGSVSRLPDKTRIFDSVGLHPEHSIYTHSASRSYYCMATGTILSSVFLYCGAQGWCGGLYHGVPRRHLVVQRFGVGLVIERSLVRLLAGVLSSKLGQLILPSLWVR